MSQMASPHKLSISVQTGRVITFTGPTCFHCTGRITPIAAVRIIIVTALITIDKTITAGVRNARHPTGVGALVTVPCRTVCASSHSSPAVIFTTLSPQAARVQSTSQVADSPASSHASAPVWMPSPQMVTQGASLQSHPSSTLQVSEHPSPLDVFPSSQPSLLSRMSSPQCAKTQFSRHASGVSSAI